MQLKRKRLIRCSSSKSGHEHIEKKKKIKTKKKNWKIKKEIEKKHALNLFNRLFDKFMHHKRQLLNFLS